MEIKSSKISQLHVQLQLQEAFRNRNILSTIFHQLQLTSDLCTCRLISKSWDELALNEISKRNLTVTFETDDGIFNFIKAFSSKTNQIPWISFNFEDTGVRFTWKPVFEFFRHFDKYVKYLKLNSHFTGPHLKQIFHHIGPQLLSLEFNTAFHQRRKGCAENADKIIFPSQSLLVNLKYLTLNCSFGAATGFGNYFLKNILTNIPGSQLEFVALNRWSNLPLTIKYLTENGQEPSRCLKILKLLELTSEDIQILVTNTVQLEEFSCRRVVNANLWDRNVMNEFLLNQKTKLKKLCCPSVVCQFPNGMKIKKLELILQGTLAGNFTPIFYEKTFPNLTSLNIDVVFQVTQMFRTQFELLCLRLQPPCESLRKFEITDEFLTVSVISKIEIIFPNISQLKIKTHESVESLPLILPAIWNSQIFAESLEKLELEIQDGVGRRGSAITVQMCSVPEYFLDSIFSGALGEEIRKINLNRMYNDYDLDRPRCNSVLKLENLKMLLLTTSRQQGYFFTDFAGYCIFEKMNLNPKNLFINEKLHQFSDECLATLRMSVNNFCRKKK